MKTLIKKINRILKDRRIRRLLTRFVSGSAALVVFVTTYALVLPAITMETEAQCGIEAHQHDDSCYEDVLACGLEESDGHTHGDSCYNISQELTCEIPEHQHDKTCYDEDGNLQCRLSEHEHTEDCYKEVRELTCTLEESEGHHHTDACYKKNLICGKEAHTHSPACYEKTETAAVAASAGYTAGVAYEVSDDDAADDFGSYDRDGLKGSVDITGRDVSEETGDHSDTDALEETGDLGDTDTLENTGDSDDIDALKVTSQNDIWEEADNADTFEAEGYSDSSEGAGSTAPSQEADNTSHSDWESPLLEESAAAGTTNVLPEDLENEELSDGYVPQLDSLIFDSVLNDHTAFYYFHPEEGEEVPANSVDITSWKPVDENTELAPTDMVKAYLAYTIPAGSLNETNQVARYRLPANLHLTEDQILAINSHENGIAAGYIDPETNTVPDEDAADYSEYLGAEAVEGTRRPDQALSDGSLDGEQEYISATVKAENVFDEEGLYGEKGAYLGQDLIFVFSPYTIQKNQTTYDKDGKPTARGEKVTGWFAIDLNMDQIDWVEEEPGLEQNDLEKEETDAGDNAVNTTTVKTADIIFSEENEETKAIKITRQLRVVEHMAKADGEMEADVSSTSLEDGTDADTTVATSEAAEEISEEEQMSEDAADADSTTEEEQAAEASTTDAKDEEKKDKDNSEPEYKAGTLTAEGKDYKITLDYTAEAKIPAEAALSVREITAETDPEVYQACLKQANAHKATGDSSVDRQASRFFDIEIVVTDEEGQPEKMEPAAPVSVNIQLIEKKDAEDKVSKDTGSAAKSADSIQDPTILHFAEEGVEQVEAETSVDKTRKDTATEVQFQAESFSIYGVIYNIKKTVIDAKGDTWEITVTYGEDAQIPDGAELRVREITEKDADYAKTRRGIEEGLTDGEAASPVNPVLFDISIWDGEKEIEPKEGSEVKVEVKLVRSALKGLFSDEDTPLLINNAPMQVENGYIERDIKVIHQTSKGDVDVMDTFSNITSEEAMTSFTTDSFSNWLVFLDESASEITVGPGDIITLRPYNEWSWDKPENQGDNWVNPAGDSTITSAADITPHTVTDSNLNHTFTFYDIKIKNNAAGKAFDVKTEGGRTVHVKVADQSPEADGAKPSQVTTVNNGEEGITFNLYDYDRGQTLDESDNEAKYWKSKDNNPKNDGRYENGTINQGKALKFLGWGYSGKYSDAWEGNWASNGILDYTGTTVSPGIVSSDLVEYTLDDGTIIKVPTLADFSGENLGYLFDTDSTFDNTDGRVQSYPNANGLFQKGSNGYYYYNSNSNYAWYNPTNNSFEVYEHTYQQHTAKNDGGNGKPIGFFPFHPYEPDKDTDGTYGEGKQWMNHNKYLNHHFGMDMAVEFAIPADGLDEFGNPITFEFSGDDDLWVFIDGKLVLDVGGLHQPVTASINFSDDVVKVNGQTDTTIQAMFNKSSSDDKTWVKGDDVPHTMQVFYLERGGCDSNLSIRFNMPTTLGKGNLKVIKNDKKTPSTLLSGAEFGLYSDARCENLIEGKDKTSGPDGILDFGDLAFKDVNTTYYLKEITAPGGYMVDTGVYRVKPYVINGEVQRDSSGNIVLQVIAPDGTSLAQTISQNSIEFPNEKVSTIDIPAEKKWSDDVVTESAQITLTIKRYKLVSQTKGLTIEQNLIGKPNNHTFQADYTITYTTADGDNRTIYIDYTKFNAGRYTITDIEPGTYTVVQNIRSGVPENYTRTDNPVDYQQQVTLPEDGAATAQFTSTYVQKKGTLNLKAVVENMPSGVSYNNVRYAILDSSGKKVTSATYQDIVDGEDFSLPVGTYSIKAVNLPKDPDGHEATRTVTKDGITVENATTSVGSVSITDGGRTEVVFNNAYGANKLVNSYFKAMDRHQNTTYLTIDLTNTNEKNGTGGHKTYKDGDVVTAKVYVNRDHVWYDNSQNNTPQVSSDNGSNVTYSYKGTDDHNNHVFEVTFTAASNNTVYFKINGRDKNQNSTVNSWYETWAVSSNSLHMPRTLRAPKGTTLGSAANNTEEIHETNPADAHTVTDPETQEPTNVPANLPAAPAYKKYVKDVLTSGSDWQKTIVLNKDNTPAPWKETLRDLEACDVDGNPYYYYVAAVDETGLEKVTTVSFGNNGDELLLIGEDNLDGNTLNVTNTVKRQGALALTKIVTLNGADNTTDMTNGDYTFTIEGVAGTSTAGETHNATIHFENGRATSYIVDGTRTDCKGTDNSWTVVLQNLTAGDYVITESQMSNNKMELTSVTGGKGDGNKDTKKVTVTVHPGDETPENDDARAAFTNNRTEKVKITVNKVWSPEPLDSEHPSITLKLHRYAKKTKGTINITLKDTMQSDPDHVSAPIEGAVFTLYEAASPEGTWTSTSTTVITDVNGNASASGLAPGKSYKLVQTSTPQRYSYNVENPPESAVLTVRDNSLQTQEVSTRNLTNEALVTSATVTLTLTESNVGSGSTDNKIDGARFKLYKDGTLYRTDDYETRDGGKIVVSGLPAGEYYFVQTAVTADYRMPADPKTVGFTVQDKPWENQSNLTQSTTNDLKGKGTITVRLKKDNEDDGAPIANADFQLRKGNDLIASARTDANGELTFANVYEGDYTVHQVNTGDAASDGYEIDPSDKPVSIAANSVTNQTPDSVVFVNECTIGDVTIRLWTKQQAVHSEDPTQRNTPYNWKLEKEYTGKHVGETYTFTATLNADIYPNFVRYAEDNADIAESPDGNNVDNYVLYNKGTGNESYQHLLKESDIQSLNSSGYNDGTYSFTLTPTEQNKVYNLVLISSWGNDSIYTFAMNEEQALRAAAPQEPQKALNSRMQAGFGAGKKALSTSGQLKNAPAATEAQPHKPSDTDYFEDNENFTPIEHTIVSSPWTYEFPAQDKYDPNGEPYYYYVEETNSTPDEYVIASYQGDPVSSTDTGSITITNTRPEYGSLKLTKALTVNGAAPKNSSDWALVTGDYTFTVKNSVQEAVKTITLHVDATGVSLVSPTVDTDVTLSAGVITIAKLPKGDYTLEETAPANGTKLSGVTVSASGSVENKVATVTVNDKNQQTEIPLVTFTNNMNTGDLSLTKQVAGEGAEEEKAFRFTIQLTAPDGQTLAGSYSFKKGEDTAEGITYTKDANNAARATVTGITLKHDEVFTIEGLPAGTTYLITEADYSSEGYSSSIPAEGLPGTITDESEAKVSVTAINTLSAGNLTVEKTLEGNATDPAKDFNFSVTFNKDGKNEVGGSYKTGTVDSIESATPHDVTFASGTATVTFTLKGGEKAEFSGLPVGTMFTVSETSRDADGYETTVSSTGGTVNTGDKTVTGSISARTAVTASYVNKKNKTTAEAAKEWQSGAQTITWPEDVEKVEFKLFKTVNGSTTAVTGIDLTSFATAEQIATFQNPVEITSSTDGKKAVWNNLPEKYWLDADANTSPAVEAGWYDATYTVKETRIVYTAASGKAGETKDIAAVNNVITNEIEKVQIHAAKQWKDKNGTVLDGKEGKAYPANAQVTFTLVKDGTPDNTHTVVLDGVDETKNPSTGATVTPAKTDYEGADWTAWFTDLPKYTDQGKLINYTVKETAKMEGYETEGSDTVGDEGTITNKEISVDINILKVDKTDGETPLAGAKFVLKRYNEGYHEVAETWPEQEVSSDAGTKGQLKFEKLAIGHYELVETNPPAGYVRTSANPRFKVKIDTDGSLKVEFTNTDMVTYDSTTKTFTVKNEPGAALPNSGGPGTRLIYLLGIVLTGIAGVGLMLRKHKNPGSV